VRTPPDDLDTSDVAAVLAVEWGLVQVTLEYAPIGFGAHHWWASVGGRRVWFVTAGRPGPGLASAFRTAAALRDAGLEFVIAPVASELGEIAVPYRGYAVSLTPWLADAVDHPGTGRDVAELAAALHGATESVRGVARVDDLQIESRTALDRALAELEQPWSSGPYAEHVRRALVVAAPRLRADLLAYDERSTRVDRGGFVVTHGELKAGNLLTTPTGLALVDWDTALLAPRERDLWRLDADDLAVYTARSGRVVDPDVIELQRDRWTLTDVALYVDQLRHASDRTADTETAWEVLRGLLG
jgi:spectinomycin phosphotransferase